MRRPLLHGLICTFMVSASGCSVLAAGADPSHGTRGAAWGRDADAAAGARRARGRAELRAGIPAPVGIGIGRAREADAPFVSPIEPADTTDLVPGALLDVWLNDRASDLRTLTSERSLGTAVVRGDFFRYNAVNSDPDLRGFWGQPLALKWSALLEITERGPHVFASELSKERGNGPMDVRTLVRLNDETLFEEAVRVVGLNKTISAVGSRVLTLAPGFYRLEVWLAANGRTPPPATQLGTFLKIRAPGALTLEPLQPSRVWHRAR